MTKDQKIKAVEDYLGNRGMFYESGEIAKAELLGKYWFILIKNEPEVELYDKTDMYGECIDGFCRKDFKWNKTYMRKCVTGEVYE